MEIEVVFAWLDKLARAARGEALSDLQRAIVRDVWQGKSYGAIADRYGCTEGHAKDVGAELWQWLSLQLGEKVSKRSLKTVLERAIASPLSALDSGTDDYWVGRQREFDRLDALVARGAKAIAIQGEGGIGKTAIAQRYLQQRPFDYVLEMLVAKDIEHLAPAESVVEEWLVRDFDLEPGRDFGVTLSRLQRQLRQQRVGILIDNLEPALDARGQFLPQLRSYVELLRVLTGSQVRSLTLLTSRDRLCEAHIRVEHLRLSGLDIRDWETYGDAYRLSTETEAWPTLHRAYGGNAKALGLLCGAIQTDWDGDVSAYWQTCGGDLLLETDLSNLIDSHLQRLQALDPEAYRLLCRMSCLRFQDLPTMPATGLDALAWDVPVRDRPRLLASLRNRSVVECRRGQFWLHPAMQEAARLRLQSSSEWEIAHRHAAQYWTKSVDSIATRAEALQALEAFYHYIEIADYSAAGAVLLESRNNRWHQYLSLGGILYRLGLVRPLRAAVTLAIAHCSENDAALGELYNLAGDTYWIAGDIQEAIASQTQSLRLTRQHLSVAKASNSERTPYFEVAELDSLLSLGLYALDLWELETAERSFQEAIELAGDRQRDRWTNKALTCLALVRAHCGQLDVARQDAERVYEALLAEPASLSTGRFAYFLQLLGRAYSATGNHDRARDLFQRTARFAREGHYSQVKAKATNGLAQLHRTNAAWPQAIALHREAIELLEEVGAQCDLAEAWFQLGVTYQLAGDVQLAKQGGNKAIALFERIPAPKQVSRVREAIGLKALDLKALDLKAIKTID